MLYNLSEFITKIKEDIGIADVPLPVDDNALIQRFANSAFKEFSVRYPRKKSFLLREKDAIDFNNRSNEGAVTYKIGEEHYKGSIILAVLGLMPTNTASGGDLYLPNVILGSADMLLGSIADIKMAASMGAMMSHAATFEFFPPDILTIYNGWINTDQRVEVALTHDLSLSTVPPGAFTNLLQLASLDIKEYLYNKMKRVTGLDVGIGSIDLKIDDWGNAAQEKRDLLDRWDDTINMDIDRIIYF